MVKQLLLLQRLHLLGDADECADVSCYFGLHGALEAGEYLAETGRDCWVLGGGVVPRGDLS